MEAKIIAKGAEAEILRKGNKVSKNRIKKGYRLPELDEKIRKQRTKREAKILLKVNKILPSPKMIKVSEIKKEIELEFISGKKLSNYLDKLDNFQEICKRIGTNTAKLHDSGIIHGDLTTSNMILKDGKVYFFDFGLGFHSDRLEDKAVDLHLIKEALEAKHPKIYEKAFKKVLEGYSSSKKSEEVLKRLKIVEKRGRYKAQY